MDKKQFKYLTEYSILMYLNKYMFIQQMELDVFAKYQNTFTEENPCNIYFILRRPRISADPEYFIVGEDFIELKYFIHIKNERLERILRVPFSDLPSDLRMETEYPHNFVKFIDKEGNINGYKLAVLVDETHKWNGPKEDLLDFEVLYIGQAFGKDGKRTALDRLSSHSTLQKIYSEAMFRNPDSEIWIMLASFEQNKVMSMNGMVQMPSENDKEDTARAAKFFNSEIEFTEKQVINFTEAALIKTFLPQYNKEYKDSFPNPSHSSYSECYNLDVNSIVVETDTRESRRWLYSVDKPRKIDGEMGLEYWQHGLFHFQNSEDRYKMFNYEYLETEDKSG
ncbi:hypothetical protein AAOE16_15870 [Ekhidna sp. MALMAid0563]|uniref:hypothetical protein n=1 Tax=Ekhidna sp. MALMAid0563 TaxID=3143937 RepID=UPI0032DEE1B1